MVEVRDKPVVQRRAAAAGRLVLRPATLAAIRDGSVAKGDVIEVARTAAVLAVKRTPDLLPYCHPIPITGVSVDLSVGPEALEVQVTVTAAYRTGVEMEALMGVTVALLTAWDLVKPLEKDAEGQFPVTRIQDVRVVEKVKQ